MSFLFLVKRHTFSKRKNSSITYPFIKKKKTFTKGYFYILIKNFHKKNYHPPYLYLFMIIVIARHILSYKKGI